MNDVMTRIYFVNPDTCKKSPIYGKVKAFLERFEVHVPITAETENLVGRGMIFRILIKLEFENDQAKAFEAFAGFRNGGRNNVLSPRQYDNFTSPTDDAIQMESSGVSRSQLSNDLTKRFSHVEAKFSGESSECSSKFVEVTPECLYKWNF